MADKPKPRTGTGDKGSSWKGKPKAKDCAQVDKHGTMMRKQPSEGWGAQRLADRLAAWKNRNK